MLKSTRRLHEYSAPAQADPRNLSVGPAYCVINNATQWSIEAVETGRVVYEKAFDAEQKKRVPAK